jgi:hypothetical protein
LAKPHERINGPTSLTYLKMEMRTGREARVAGEYGVGVRLMRRKVPKNEKLITVLNHSRVPIAACRGDRHGK